MDRKINIIAEFNSLDKALNSIDYDRSFYETSIARDCKNHQAGSRVWVTDEIRYGSNVIIYEFKTDGFSILHRYSSGGSCIDSYPFAMVELDPNMKRFVRVPGVKFSKAAKDRKSVAEYLKRASDAIGMEMFAASQDL